jgi:hypothetical protein
VKFFATNLLERKRENISRLTPLRRDDGKGKKLNSRSEEISQRVMQKSMTKQNGVGRIEQSN